MEEISFLLIGFSPLYWGAAYLAFSDKSQNPFWVFLKSIFTLSFFIALVLCIRYTGDGGFLFGAILAFLFPHAIFPLALSHTNIDYVFASKLTILAIVIFLPAVYFSYKRSENIVISTFVAASIAFFIMALAGNIIASNAIDQSLKKHNFECHKIKKKFDESIFSLSDLQPSHAEGFKDGDLYLWSYKKMDFIKITPHSRYKGITSCK